MKTNETILKLSIQAPLAYLKLTIVVSRSGSATPRAKSKATIYYELIQVPTMCVNSVVNVNMLISSFPFRYAYI